MILDPFITIQILHLDFDYITCLFVQVTVPSIHETIQSVDNFFQADGRHFIEGTLMLAATIVYNRECQKSPSLVKCERALAELSLA